MIDRDDLKAIIREVLDERFPPPPPPVPPPPPPVLHPHRLKHKGQVFRDIDPDKDGHPTGRAYVGITQCPDCGVGLRSGSGTDDEMICSRIPRGVDLPGSGGVIACGIEWPDP